MIYFGIFALIAVVLTGFRIMAMAAEMDYRYCCYDAGLYYYDEDTDEYVGKHFA